MKARFYKQSFQFKRPSGTSRGVLTEKHSWMIELWNENQPNIIGVGECSIIPGLSPDFLHDTQYEAEISALCNDLSRDLTDFPSIQFGLETALLDLKNGGKRIIFDNDFAKGKQQLPINGLIWMGDEDFMREQIEEKIATGFSTIKLKIGAIDFDTEIKILESIRKRFDSNQIVLRVDANGAFSTEEVISKLEVLSQFGIHSIEQPIKAGQWTEMAQLCACTPIAIALDEELIGVNQLSKKTQLLETIKPQFIILKPSLHGGIMGCKEWISLAEQRNIPWWMTSALESNIGLDAICQFAAEYQNDLPQGLGTGSLYVENTPTTLTVENGMIFRLNHSL